MGSVKSFRRAAEAVSAPEVRARSLEQVLAQIGEAVIVKDLDATVTYWNREAASLYGFSSEEAIGQPLRKLHAADLSEMDYAKVLKRIRAGRPTSTTTERRKRNGEHVRVAIRTTPLLDANGRLIGEITVARDVTQLLGAEEALRDSEERYRVLTSLSSDWSWEQDAEFRFVSLSKTVPYYSGLSYAEHVGKTRWELPNSEPIDTTWEEHKALLRAHKEFRGLLIRRMSTDGKMRYASFSGTPIFDPAGNFIGYRGVGSDVTDRLMAEERFRATFEQAAVGIAHVSLDGQHLMVNRKYCEMLGYTEEELLAMDTDVVKDPIGAAKVSQRDELLAGAIDHYSVEQQFLRKNGVPLWVNRSISLARDAHGKPLHIIRVIEDISERRAAEERLTYLAQYDSLTGLPNRTLVRDRLSLAIARAKRNGQTLAVLFLDMDDFSDINDSLGHACGDQVLQAAGGLLRTSLRDVDAIGRIGGDEFTIVLENITDEDQVLSVAEKVKKAFAAPLVIHGREIFVSASIGIALYPQGGESVDALLQSADVAMYHAKGLGRSTHAFGNATLTAEASERFQMSALLRRAVEREEFILHYQPIVDVRKHNIVGMEALIRLESKEVGMIPPAKFIPLSEATGLILPIGEWVLKTACAQAKAWQMPGQPPMTMSVNLSARQLRGEGFVEMVAQTLSDTGLPPECLELEITESQFMEDAQDTINKLVAIRQLGVSFALDDFGTGYSSLGNLSKLRVQTLKIDRSFVATMLNDVDALSLVSTILTLARSLRLKVIAEGVETDEQEKALRLLGCDEMQGYLFSRPVPADEFEALLTKHRRGMQVVEA